MALLAIIGIYGSLKVGIGWGDEGPRAGFFPFYVSVIVLGSCIINTITVFTSTTKTRVFAEWSQLRQVLSVLAPTVIYVALVPYIGIYVASALLIGFFMAWFGRYNLIVSAAVAVVVPVLTFLMFEIWFLVPLPKGALESMLGF
ncbi:MAG TPA: tripartite tricarboxylate transporter TctB family protein [Pseudolabrys sp.]|nr:tripartite tricarboxylate transporter TctB family protein [Pseudolabrys sp.]